jgi:ABC-2 type transport system permease protein
MTTIFAHSGFMALRHLRNLMRQPWYIAFTLVQPVIYLLLFGELFKRVVEIPGFGAGSYIVFLTPGIVVMTALFSAGWNGMTIVQDLDRGVMDRFLIAPTSRVALIAGQLIQLAVIVIIQSLIIIGLGLLRGADFPGGAPGVMVLIGASILLAAPFGALSNALALVVHQEESVIAGVNFVLLPLTFLSSVFMAQSLMPAWMQSVARFNPVNWAVQAAREALTAQADWTYVLTRLGWLFALTVACAWIATLAFRAYQRSV